MKIESKVITDIKIDGDCCFSGDLYFEPDGDTGHIIVTGRIQCRNLKIKAGWCIDAGGSINAGGYIDAGGDINAGEYIDAGEYIKAGGFCFSFSFEIRCKLLKTKTCPFWRHFYAHMQPLRQFREIICSDACWDEIRDALRPNATEIVSWDGWHPILRAHLKMYLGLCTEVEGKDLV